MIRLSGARCRAMSVQSAWLLLFTIPACGGDGSTPPAPSVSTVEVTPSSSALSVGFTLQLVATVRDADGDLLTRSPDWTTDDPAVLQVSSSGLVTALKVGAATVSASVDGVAGAAEVTAQVPVAGITIAPDTATVLVGDTLQADVTLVDSAGNLLTGREIAWTASDPAVVQVTGAGVIAPVGPGVAQVTATVDGKTAITSLTVIAFKVIAAGSSHTCALSSDGVAYCWGLGSTTPAVVTRDLAFGTIVSGLGYSCALSAAGAAYCWGDNSAGQLGDGTTSAHATPVPVSGGLTFSALTAGDTHACGLSADGAYCWGFNASGQLGDGTQTASSVPVRVATDVSFRIIAAGFIHTCAATFTFTVYCWGDNTFEEVGQPVGTGDPHLVPTPVLEGTSYQSISAGYFDSCGVKQDGAGFCWGYGFAGRLGADVIGGTTSTPIPVSGGLSFRSVDAGEYVTCGLTVAGDAYCWGDNQFGELGDASPSSPMVSDPHKVAGGLAFTALSTGGFHACGVTTKQVTYCWGRGDGGQLGWGEQSGRSVPVRATLRP